MKNIHDELQKYWCGYFVDSPSIDDFPNNAGNILTECHRPFWLLYSYAYNDTKAKALPERNE